MGRRPRNAQEYHLKNPVHILPDIPVPEPQDGPAAPLQMRRAHRVLLHLQRMMPTIQFDSQAQAPACEIKDITIYDQLPREPRPHRFQHASEIAFLLRGLTPKPSRVHDQFGRNALHGSPP